MTNKEKVLAVYPDAVCKTKQCGVYIRHRIELPVSSHKGKWVLSNWSSISRDGESEAWFYAAKTIEKG